MTSRDCDYVVALVGAPNTGKTTLFNALTGASALVANWPGATTDVRYAKLRLDSKTVCLVDLPGTYSVNGSGPEEKVTRDFLLTQPVDAVLVIADSTNLERGLFLVLDVAEFAPRMIVVLTKIDEAEKRGIEIDVEGLSRALCVPVVPVSALRGIGIEQLKETIRAVLEGRVEARPCTSVVVPEKLRGLHAEIARILEQAGLPRRRAAWLAARLLEDQDWAWGLVEQLAGRSVAERIRELVAEAGEPGERAALFAEAKYEEASRLYSRYVRSAQEAQAPEGLSRLDRVFLHPVLGPIASLSAMFVLFLLTYAIATGSPLDLLLDSLGLHGAAEFIREYNLVELVARLMDWVASVVESSIPNPVLAKLVGEGLFSSSYGVGLVMTFMPLVMVLMVLIAALEDSGLVPRIAAGMDKFFRRFGVSGKAVFPAMLSLGCNVPGVIATRIMDTEVERRAMVFAVPLIPCMARLTVLLAFANAYFGSGLWSSLAVFAVYMIAITVFLITLKLMTRGSEVVEEELLLELPPVKKPSLKVIWWLTWDKLKHFLVRAGTVIAVASLVLWLLANYGPQGYLGGVNEANSYAAQLGHLLAPYVSIIFGTPSDISWRLGFGFIGGFIAKEVFLDALAAVAPAKAVGPVEVLRSYGLTAAQALAVMVAVTLYMPCVATLSAMYSETRDAKLVAAALLYDTTVASIAALLTRLLLEAV